MPSFSSFPHPANARRRNRGFTLIEMIAATAILAVAMVSLLKATGDNVRNLSALSERTLAQWAAEDYLSQMKLLGEWPDKGSSRKTYEVAERTWYLTLDVQALEDDDLRRVAVDVRSQADARGVSYRLIGFIANPALQSRFNTQPEPVVTQ